MIRKRKTIAFSYDKADDAVFKRLRDEARGATPKVHYSAMLIHILRRHFETQDMMQKIQNGEMSSK